MLDVAKEIIILSPTSLYVVFDFIVIASILLITERVVK